MDGEFDRELDDGGWGPPVEKRAWKPLSRQIQVLGVAVSKAEKEVERGRWLQQKTGCVLWFGVRGKSRKIESLWVNYCGGKKGSMLDIGTRWLNRGNRPG